MEFISYNDLTIDEKINVKSWVCHSFEPYDKEHIHLLFFARLGVAVNAYYQQNIDCPYSKEATLFKRNWPQTLQEKIQKK